MKEAHTHGEQRRLFGAQSSGGGDDGTDTHNALAAHGSHGTSRNGERDLAGGVVDRAPSLANLVPTPRCGWRWTGGRLLFFFLDSQYWATSRDCC